MIYQTELCSPASLTYSEQHRHLFFLFCTEEGETGRRAQQAPDAAIGRTLHVAQT